MHGPPAGDVPDPHGLVFGDGDRLLAVVGEQDGARQRGVPLGIENEERPALVGGDLRLGRRGAAVLRLLFRLRLLRLRVRRPRERAPAWLASTWLVPAWLVAARLVPAPPGRRVGPRAPRRSSGGPGRSIWRLRGLLRVFLVVAPEDACCDRDSNAPTDEQNGPDAEQDQQVLLAAGLRLL